jgi:pSer/pThr/pTyr-binding forkhead associated (FHA) protein
MRVKSPSEMSSGFLISGVHTMMKALVSLNDFGDILTPIDVQRVLRIGRNATYELIASGRLPSIRVSPRRIIVTRRSLEAFLGLASNMPPAGTP